MNYFYPFLTFILPVVAMLTGLIAAPIGFTLIMFLSLNHLRDRMNIEFFKNQKLEISFLIWLLISCSWSADSLSALAKLLCISFVIIFTNLCVIKLEKSNQDFKKLFLHPLAIGCFFAIVSFAIEYFSNGFLSRNFRYLFSPEDKQNFELYHLDRGCTVLAVLSWAVMLFLVKIRRFWLALIYFIAVTILLSVSDSLSGFLGFLIGGIVALFFLITRMRLFPLVILAIIGGSIAMPVFSYTQSPRELSNTYATAPASGKHRLFIWKYTATKAMEKVVTGWGFNASRKFPVDEENDIIYYNQYKWSPLPLHPHNNFLQIWLEGGLIGLALFTALVVKLLLSIQRLSADYGCSWGAFATGCFVNYFFIGMISFGMWQLWWVTIGALAMILFKMIAIDTKNSKV